MPSIYASIADAAGADFFDAASVVNLDEVGVDGIHLLVEGNRDLAMAVAQRVQKLTQ